MLCCIWIIFGCLESLHIYGEWGVGSGEMRAMREMGEMREINKTPPSCTNAINCVSTPPSFVKIAEMHDII
jgi:hypothetical protein